MADWLSALTRKADLRRKAGLERKLITRADAVDLAGNDYLGLSRHPRVLAAASAALVEFGLGATGSRLVRGTTDAHVELESALAGWLGAEQALVYSSGYLANLGAIRALCGPQTLLLSDAHCHASMVDGCRLSKAETVIFEHANLDSLRKHLRAHPDRPKVVLTESIFSVDGDLAPLSEIHRLAREHDALLLVDDAHALGVIGPQGAGGVVAAGLAGQPDVIVTATLSKSLGGAGGVVAGPEPLIRHLIDTGRTFIYDTALPPAVAAGVRVALDLAKAGDDLRAELHDRAAQISSRVPVPGGVISLAADSAEQAWAWATACREKGVAVGCFRPPSTPDSRSRLRLTVNVGVPRADFDHALEVIETCRPL